MMKEILEYIKENKDALTIIISTILGIIALATLIKAIIEFQLQGRQKRAELFTKFENAFDQDQIKKIASMLETKNTKIAKIPLIDRVYFLGLYEQIYLAINSKLINKEIAYYMFGSFALDCWDNAMFWTGINKDGEDWYVFRLFVEDMTKIREKNRKRPYLRGIRAFLSNRSLKQKFKH